MTFETNGLGGATGRGAEPRHSATLRLFAVGIAVSLLSAIAIFQASPGKIRAVAGKVAQG